MSINRGLINDGASWHGTTTKMWLLKKKKRLRKLCTDTECSPVSIKWITEHAEVHILAEEKCISAHVLCALSRQSCLTLSDPMDCSLPGSSVHWILQARILEWVAMPFQAIFLTQGSNCISCVSWTGRGFFTTSATWEAYSTHLTLAG